MPTYSELVSFTRDRDSRKTTSIYHTEQYSRNARTVIEQNLVIKGDGILHGYTADMRFDDFPASGSGPEQHENRLMMHVTHWMPLPVAPEGGNG